MHYRALLLDVIGDQVVVVLRKVAAEDAVRQQMPGENLQLRRIVQQIVLPAVVPVGLADGLSRPVDQQPGGMAVSPGRT